MLPLANEAYITRLFYSEGRQSTGPQYLSLLLAPDTFMYAIMSGDQALVTELCHIQLSATGQPPHDYADTIALLVNSHLLHQKKFAKVSIAVLNSEFALAPAAYAEGSSPKAYLQFATGALHTLAARRHDLKGVSFCYSIEPALLSFLERTFASASIRHAGAVNISLLFGHHSLKSSQVLLAIGGGSMELAVRSNGDLLLYNVFKYGSNEDVLYYLLFAMEQLGLDPLQTSLAIAGERPAGDELVNSIKKYIKQVSFAVHSPGLTLKGEPGQLPAHYYFTLLNQHLCEL